MKRPRKAILLAAGFGSRLSPLTLDCPKPLVPVQGKPMILHQLELLKSWGVDEVLVNVHFQAEQLIRVLPDICPQGLKLNFSFEPEILGTGGGLRRMAWFVDDDPLWVCNADVLQKLDPQPLLKAWENNDASVCLWMVAGKGPQTVKVENGKVMDFRAGGLTFSGLHLLNRKALEALPDTSFSSVIEGYDRMLAAGGNIMGVEVPGSEWSDIGTPEQLLDAEGGPVVFPGARVSGRVKLERAIVGPGARLRSGAVSGLVVSPERGLEPAERKRLPEVEAVELLPVRGSDRSFRRLYFPDHREILVKSGEARPENDRLPGHTRYLLRNGIRVPVILQSREQGRWLRMEDLGNEHLLDRLQGGRDARNLKDMREVLERVAAFHALRIPASLELEAPFDEKYYAWERALFANEYVRRHGEISGLRKTHKARLRIPEILMAQPQVLVHRDLQSTNVMWVGRGRRPRSGPGKWAFIDYQGMRMGAAAYDLGSLLADPYVNRPPPLQLRLLEQYNRVAVHPVSVNVYAAGAVQRLLQALGAYGRLGALKGNERFLRHIPAALEQLEHWTDVFCEGQSGTNPVRDQPHE